MRSRPGRWPDFRGADAGAGTGPEDEDECQDGSGSGRTPTFPSTRPPAREPRPSHPRTEIPAQTWAAVTEQLAPKFVHFLLPPCVWVPSASPLLLQSVLLSAAAAAKSLQSDSVRPHRRQPTRLPRPWDSPGKNTGVGCHFLLQCMKVKSESEVAQSGPTLSDPMDCSPPGFSVHGIFQARVLEWGAIAFSADSVISST